MSSISLMLLIIRILLQERMKNYVVSCPAHMIKQIKEMYLYNLVYKILHIELQNAQQSYSPPYFYYLNVFLI